MIATDSVRTLGWRHVGCVVTRASLLVGLVLTGSAVVTAQENADAPLTLGAAVELALRNHPAIREARAGSVAASADVGVARTAYLPRLNFLWQVNRATRNNVFGLLLPQGVDSVRLWARPRPRPSTASGAAPGECCSPGRPLILGGVARRLIWRVPRPGSTEAQRPASELNVAGAAPVPILAIWARAQGLMRAASVERLDTFAKSAGAGGKSAPGRRRAIRTEAELAAAGNRLIEADGTPKLRD